MATEASKLIFLFFLLLLTISTSGTLVGFSYNTVESTKTLSLDGAISFLKQNKVFPSQIRVLAADHNDLNALRNTGASVDIYLNQSQVENLVKSKSSALSWLKTHLLPFLPHVNIKSVTVNSINDSNKHDGLLNLLSTLKFMRSLLSSFHLESQVKVSVSLSLSFFEHLSKAHQRYLHRVFNYIKEVNSFVILEASIDEEELSMGDRFVHLMIKKANLVTSLLSSNGVPLVLTIKCPSVPNDNEVIEFSDKVSKALGNNYEITKWVLGLYAEVAVIEDFTRKELNREIIFPSFSRELSELHFETSLHNSINPTTTVFPTIPSDNTTPTIVTVPSTNPATITPTNPTSPVTIPSTPPVNVLSNNPANNPLPVTNPATTPTAVPGQQPISNPVTTNPAPPGNVPPTNPVAPPGNVPPTNPVTNPVAPPGNVPPANPVTNPVAPPGNVPPANPVTNPVAPPGNVPPANPVTNPVAPPGNVPPTNPVTNPVAPPGNVPPANPVTNPVAPPGNVPPANPVTNPVAPPGNVPPANPVTNPVAPPGNVPPTNPVTNPVAPPGYVPPTNPVTNPVAPPATTSSPAVPGKTWCVAKSGAPQTALQSALDYACGAGADCSQIQQGASCYNPTTLQNHASYAFNSFYQKNPAPTSCDFGGTATLVNVNPSTGSCIFPSSSQSSTSSTPPSTTSSTPSFPTSTTPPTISSPAWTGSSGSGSPPSVLNSSNPASGTSTDSGFDSPPGFNSTTSQAIGLQPFIGCIFLLTSLVTRNIMLYM